MVLNDLRKLLGGRMRHPRRCRLVDESAARPSNGRVGRVDGGVTAARPHTGDSSLRSGLSVTSEEYQQFLAAHQITESMSSMGSCADNATAESFFARLNRERVNRWPYWSRAESRAGIFDNIERWHNPRQRRRLAFQQEGQKLLTHLSIETG